MPIFDASGLTAKKITDKSGAEWRELGLADFDVLSLNKDGEPKEVKIKSGFTVEKFTTELNVKGHYANILKPDILEDKLLTDEESKQVKLALCNCGLVDDVTKKVKEGRNLIFVQAKPAKNDYRHDYDRGTIHFTTDLRVDGTPLLRNYSFHKVIVPDGAMIKSCNFTQRVADTEAISGKNLTFVDCNLVNVKVDPTWTLQNCNNCQIQKEIKSQVDLGNGKTRMTVAHKVRDKKTSQFVEVETKEEEIRNDEIQNRLLYFEGVQ